jgi:hypothetical protein
LPGPLQQPEGTVSAIDRTGKDQDAATPPCHIAHAEPAEIEEVQENAGLIDAEVKRQSNRRNKRILSTTGPRMPT